MATTLQNLHQSLYQLKHSKLLDNDIFKELYDQAKEHEKHANLNNLITRSKNDKLVQETNFYLILAKMLNELKDCDEATKFNTNLERVYKWYLLNKKNFSKEAKTKKKANKAEVDKSSKMVTREKSPFERQLSFNRSNSTSRAGYSIQKDDEVGYDDPKGPLFSIRTSRHLSPVYFPTLRSSSRNQNKPETEPKATNKASTEEKQENNKLPELNHRKRSQTSTDFTSRSSNSNSKSIEAEIYRLKTKMDDKTRESILKALSDYANQLYNNLDKKDTNKLESNLKSLSKFYDTLNNTENGYLERRRRSVRSSLTVQSLVEMAKEVSDQMIINKAQTNIRISENKLLIESYSGNNQMQKNNNVNNDPINDSIDNILNLKPDFTSMSGSSEALNLPVYSITIKTSSKRPKSTSYSDWRGQISRPTTGKKRKNGLKINLRPFSPSRPKTSPLIASLVQKMDNFGDSDAVKIEDDKDIREEERLRRHRSLLRSRQKQQEARTSPDTKDNKEVKFMSFVKQSEPMKRIPSNSSIKDSPDKKPTESMVSIDNTKDEVLQIKDKDEKEETSNVEKAEENPEIVKPESVVPPESRHGIQCLHDEIAMCECCKYPSTPITSFVGLKPEIFHLTTTNDEANSKIEQNKDSRILNETPASVDHHNESIMNTNNNQNVKIGLREILISNYDPKFASKIGINEFIPIQIMTAQVDGKIRNLEFIPFEEIDQSYPKMKGHPVFDPNHNKPQPKLYRTNPSIPRPESKYGSKSTVYEQILELKKQNLDPNDKALAVWQPEDVHLVRDLLDLVHEPLNEVLKVESLRPELTDQELEDKKVKNFNINRNITPMGRPVNMHTQVRWKRLDLDGNPIIEEQPEFSEVDPDKSNESDKLNNSCNNTVRVESIYSKDILDYQSDVMRKPNGPQFKITGNPFLPRNYLAEGRPIPTDQVVEDPVKKEETLMKFNEAKRSVHIPTIFKGTTVQNYVKELNSEERLRKELQRMAAIKIQENYRKHLRDKRFIENRPPLSPEAIEWARNYKKEMLKRKAEKERTTLEEKLILEKENMKLKNLLKRIGIHVDLFKVLSKRGPEYTNKILGKAATCIQRWVRGWLLRKEMKKLKDAVTSGGVSWSVFTKRYKKTVIRILKIRSDFKTEFEFKPREAMDFYLKEKKLSSYFDKLSFANELDINDVDKMFNYADMYPSLEEINEAKQNVIKYHKLKKNITSIDKNIMLDIIYYIYPPIATKLKSTRRSTWLNPVVGQEDALRLKGFKLIEPTNFEKCWKLVRNATLIERNMANQNTPEPKSFEDNQQ